MQYAITFLEGIVTFISPCLLPMLPIYISYFAGCGERSLGKTLRGALGFVLGFTIVFMVMGALAGTVGSFLTRHQTAVNIVSGLLVIFFGLNFLGVFRLNLFGGFGKGMNTDKLNFFPPCSSAWSSPSAGRPAWAHSWAPRWCLPPSRALCSQAPSCCFATRWVWACPSCSARC